MFCKPSTYLRSWLGVEPQCSAALVRALSKIPTTRRVEDSVFEALIGDPSGLATDDTLCAWYSSHYLVAGFLINPLDWRPAHQRFSSPVLFICVHLVCTELDTAKQFGRFEY